MLRTATMLSFGLAAIAAAGAVLAQTDPVTEQGRRLFTQLADPPCALCHTLRDAGATGDVGPSFNALKPDEGRVRQALRSGAGQMPAYVTLSEEQQNTLARYVSEASRR